MSTVRVLWNLKRFQTFSSTQGGPRVTVQPGLNEIPSEDLEIVLEASKDKRVGLPSYINSGDFQILGKDDEPVTPPDGWDEPGADDEEIADLMGDDMGGAADTSPDPKPELDEDTQNNDDGGAPAGGEETAPPAGGDDDEIEDDDAIPETLDDYTVEGAAEVIGDVFDETTLKAWAAAETTGEDRKGIAKAIADQLELIETAGD